MTDILHLDLETRSAADLRKIGAYAYWEHPTTDVWVACYAFDDDPVRRWWPGEPCPADVYEHIAFGGEVVAHNAAFERLGIHHCLSPKYGWPEPALEQWDCTMARAYAMSLPGNLAEACSAAGVEVEKDMKGHRVMMQMCKPRRVEDDGTIVWWDDAERQERLAAYCEADVEAERALSKRLLRLRPQEREIWLLDQRINDRGVYIDAELCNAALKVVDATTKRLDKEMKQATNGRVSRCSMAQALKEWLCDRGVEAKGVAKDDLANLLVRDDLPADCRQALLLRQEAAKTSTAKIQKMLDMRCKDGRVRGNLQYHGAGTGRWAARGVQMQNLPRPETDDVEAAIGLLRTGDPDLMAMAYDRPLSVVSDCIRGMLAAEGTDQ